MLAINNCIEKVDYMVRLLWKQKITYRQRSSLRSKQWWKEFSNHSRMDVKEGRTKWHCFLKASFGYPGLMKHQYMSYRSSTHPSASPT